MKQRFIILALVFSLIISGIPLNTISVSADDTLSEYEEKVQSALLQEFTNAELAELSEIVDDDIQELLSDPDMLTKSLDGWYDLLEDDYDYDEIDLIYRFYWTVLGVYGISKPISMPTSTPTGSPVPTYTPSKSYKTKDGTIIEYYKTTLEDIYYDTDYKIYECVEYDWVFHKTEIGNEIDDIYDYDFDEDATYSSNHSYINPTAVFLIKGNEILLTYFDIDDDDEYIIINIDDICNESDCKYYKDKYGAYLFFAPTYIPEKYIPEKPDYSTNKGFVINDLKNWSMDDWNRYMEQYKDEGWGYTDKDIEMIYDYYQREYGSNSSNLPYNTPIPTPTPTPTPTPIPTQSKTDKKGHIIVEKEGLYPDDIYFTLDGYKIILGKTTLGDIVANTDYEVYEYLYTRTNNEGYSYNTELSVGKKIDIDKYKGFDYDYLASSGYSPKLDKSSISDRVVIKNKDNQMLLSINNKKGIKPSECTITNIQQLFHLGQLYGSDGPEGIDVPLSSWFSEVLSEYENHYYMGWNYKYTYVSETKDSPLKLFGITLSGNKDKDIKTLQEKFSDNVSVIDDVILLKLRDDYLTYNNKNTDKAYTFSWTCYGYNYPYEDEYYHTTYPFKSKTTDKKYKYLFITYDNMFNMIDSEMENYIVIGEIRTNNALMSAKERKAENKKYKIFKKKVAKIHKEKEKIHSASQFYIDSLVKFDTSFNIDNYNDKGKLNITKYGINSTKPFYLDGYPLYATFRAYYGGVSANYAYNTIKNIIKNTGYKLYDWNGNEIDINKDKGVYENKIMYIKKGDTKYIIGVQSPYGKDYSYIKDMTFGFYEYGSPYYTQLETIYPVTITAQNDYYLKKTFSIKNAPSLNNFKEEFMKKLSGKGINLVSITKLSSSTGYQVKIPYIKYDSTEATKYLTITYKYDSKTRKCIEIDWSF